jgi:hypothetical protein
MNDIYDATVAAHGTDPLAEADVVAAAEAITREVAS